MWSQLKNLLTIFGIHYQPKNSTEFQCNQRVCVPFRKTKRKKNCFEFLVCSFVRSHTSHTFDLIQVNKLINFILYLFILIGFDVTVFFVLHSFYLLLLLFFSLLICWCCCVSICQYVFLIFQFFSIVAALVFFCRFISICWFFISLKCILELKKHRLRFYST